MINFDNFFSIFLIEKAAMMEVESRKHDVESALGVAC